MNKFITSDRYEHVEHSEMNNIKFFISKTIYIPFHYHNDFEFVQIIEGKIEIRTAKETAELQAGEIALFNPNEFHALESTGSDCITLVIQIDPDFCIQHYPAIKYMRFNTANITSAVPFRICLDMIPICYNLGYNYYSRITGYELKCMSDLFRLFWYVVAYVPYTTINDSELLSQKNRQHRFCKIIEYIRNHYTEKITLSEIAAKEGLSLVYLSHLFKEHMNINFQQYVTTLRLEKALFLLKSTDMNILDICLSSGFSDSKYLNKHFIQKYHISPKDFRKKYNGRSDNQTNHFDDSKKQLLCSNAEGLQILRKHYHFDCDDPKD